MTRRDESNIVLRRVFRKRLADAIIEAVQLARGPGVRWSWRRMDRWRALVVIERVAEPATDRPITAYDLAPVILELRDAWDTAERISEPHQFDRPSERLIEWAAWVMSSEVGS
jgi:hypothetical protein